MLNFFTIFLIAVSLSMDTFSLSIIYGTIFNKKSKILLLSIIVGIYHFIMPFLGNIIGYNIINKLPISPDFVVGIILIIISIEMIITKEEKIDLQSIWSFFIFGFTVSIDSFSVGIGISTITNKYLLSYITFAFVSMMFTYIGLRFGKYLNSKFGSIATKIGAGILILFGVSYIF